MDAPLHFDSHTSYHPFSEVEALVRKSPDPHAFSLSFEQKGSLRFKADCEDVYRFLGIDSKARCSLYADYISAIKQMVFEHYHDKIFPSGKQHVLILKDRNSISACWNAYSDLGVVVEEIEPDEGIVTLEVLKRYVHPRTSFVSIPWANPLTGVVQPVMELAKFCKERGIDFHTDLSFVVGKRYFSLKDFDFTYVTCDAKAFHGPWNLSFFITHNKPRELLIEDLRWPILREALYHAFERIDDYHLEIARLRKSFEKKLKEELKDEAITIYPNLEKLPHVSLIEFPMCMNQILCAYLAKAKVYTSYGERDLCFLEEVLSKRGIKIKSAKSALCFYFPYNITEANIIEAVRRIKEEYDKAKLFAKSIV